MTAPTILTAREPATGVDAAAAASVLDLLALAAPGDTALALTADGVVVGTRTMLGASATALADADAALRRLVRHAAATLRALDESRRVAEASASPAQSDELGRPSAFLTGLLSTIVTVAATQRGWPAPDPTAARTATLAPGTWYQVLERTGDWAKVRGEDGTLCFTDARTLVPVPSGGPTSCA